MIPLVWVAWPFNMKIQPWRYNFQKNKPHLKLKEMECFSFVNIGIT